MTVEKKREIKALSATGMLGSGFREESLLKAMEWGPDFIGVDSGSTDPGPYYLGSGEAMFGSRSYERDLRVLLREGVPRKTPVLVGSAGMAGGNVHVDRMVDIVRKLAKELGLHFKLAVVHSEVDREWLKAKLRAGKVQPLTNAPLVDEKVIDRSSRIVAMMGHDPFIWALEGGAEVVVAGRSSDTSIYAAVPMMHNLNPGTVWHAAKILECGAAAVTHRTVPDCMCVTINDDCFIVEPPAPDYRCTPQSVATHNLHENSSPVRMTEPMGTLVTSDARYEAISDRAVKVSGSRFEKSDKYTLKLEGAELVGYQSVILGGMRDPVMLEQVEAWVAEIREASNARVKKLFPEIEKIVLNFRIYGLDGVMGPLEPIRRLEGHEAVLVIDVTAPSQDVANTVAASISHFVLHYPIPHWHGSITALAYPYAPAVLVRGPVYVFNMNHVVEIDGEAELRRVFPMRFESL